MYLVLKIALWGKVVNKDWGRSLRLARVFCKHTKKKPWSCVKFAKPENSYCISHPGFYKNKILHFKEQKASLVRIKNICVLFMTIFRKTWRSTAHEKKKCNKTLMLNRKKKKKTKNLELSFSMPITFLLLFAFHQFLSNHIGLKRVSTHRTWKNNVFFFSFKI